jgi:transcriptional regulator with XRE-family HTH domain
LPSLKAARKSAQLTQQAAAARLGISQAYLALLENGRRPVTSELASKLAKLYRLGPTAEPLETRAPQRTDSASIASALAALGYPGFRQLRHGRPKNPAVILLAAITATDLEVRVIEALPWLVAQYPDLNWRWLIGEAKAVDAQNRLGFIVTLARKAAEARQSPDAANFRDLENTLERSRLAREDTLCQESLTAAERQWLRERRPPDARHWNLLTDSDVASVSHAA